MTDAANEPAPATLDERLIQALDANDTDAALALLDAGADPNATVALPDGAGTIPALYFPSNHGNVTLVRQLLERGARPTDGESLYHAAEQGHEGVLALLAEFGADLSHGPAEPGNTPLHFLLAHDPWSDTMPRIHRSIAWLLAHGANPAVPSHAGARDHAYAGETPLHRAAALGHDTALMDLLLAHGAPLNGRRDDGATPYQLAVRCGHAETAQHLAAAGADTTLTAVDRLLAACLAGDEPAARVIVASEPGLVAALAPADRGALGHAAAIGRLEAVRLMLALGWPLTHEGEWGGTPLHWAAWHGQAEVVELLLAAGAPVNVRDARYGSSPIAWCAHGSHFNERANDTDWPRITARLLDAGATRAEAINHWNEPPEAFARPSVLAVLTARGFVPKETA